MAKGISTGTKGHGRNFEHDRKSELYRVNNAAANVAQAGQQVSPLKNETFVPKLNPEARPFNSNAPTKCDFPNCNQSAPMPPARGDEEAG